VTRHHELGYWSWMDGQLETLVTYKDGKAEAITVTPAFFTPQGWTARIHMANGRYHIYRIIQICNQVKTTGNIPAPVQRVCRTS